jgi:hypothetical protein
MTDGTGKGPGAELILFPGHFRRPINDAERLDRAIHTLEQVIAELRENISDWRNATNALTVSVCDIAEILQISDDGLMTARSHLRSGRVLSATA